MESEIVAAISILIAQAGGLALGFRYIQLQFKNFQDQFKSGSARMVRIEKKINNGLSTEISKVKEDVAYLRGQHDAEK